MSAKLILIFLSLIAPASYFAQQPQPPYAGPTLVQRPSQQPPFDRLEALALIVGTLYDPSAAHEIDQRGLSFVPDALFLAAVQDLNRGAQIVEALKRANQTPLHRASAQREAAYELLLIAVQDLRKRLYVSAQAEFQSALKLAPDSATLHLAYAAGLLMIQKYPQAEIESRRSLQLWADDADAHTVLAVSLSGQNRDSEAIPEAREALRLFPRHKAALVSLGASLTRNRQFDDAIPVLREAVSRTPEMPLLRKHLGVSLLHSGDVDGSIEQLTFFLRAQPDDAEGHYQLGVALRAKGRQSEARAQFREAARLEPDNPLYVAVGEPEGHVSADSTDAKPDLGSVSNNTYTNQFFGFSYEFPRGWTVLGAEAGRTMLQIGGAMLANGDPTFQDVQQAVSRNDYPLLFAQGGLTKEGALSLRSVQIHALNVRLAPGVQSGEGFAKKMAPLLGQFQGAMETMGPPEELQVGGKKFWRLNLTIKVGSATTSVSEIAIVEKGYLLLFVFTAQDADGRDDLVKTMQSLHFTEGR